jgi:small subunit ribosomal protein S1
MPEEKKRKTTNKKEGGDKVRKTAPRKTRMTETTPGSKKEEFKKARPGSRRIATAKTVEETKKPKVVEAAPAEKKEEKKDITRINLAELEDREYSENEFKTQLEMYEITMGEMKEGEIIKGKVMGVTKDDVIVDVGFKSEGIIPITEFPYPLNIRV